MVDLSGEKLGLKTAVADALAGNAGAMASDFVVAEQLDLLPLRKADQGAEAENRLSTSAGKGRPAGSKNRRTQEMADFILSQYRSPLIALAETYSRPVQDLAKELACDKLEAFKLQMAAAKELAPYVHQKMPMAVDVGEGGLIGLTINLGNHANEVSESDGFNLEIIDVPAESAPQQNQALSDNCAPKSNDIQSNEAQEITINTALNHNQTTD